MSHKLNKTEPVNLWQENILRVEAYGIASCIPAGIVVGFVTHDTFIGVLGALAVICGFIAYAGLIAERYFE